MYVYIYTGTEFTVTSAYCYSHDLTNCDAMHIGRGMNSSNETTASVFREVTCLFWKWGSRYPEMSDLRTKHHTFMHQVFTVIEKYDKIVFLGC